MLKIQKTNDDKKNAKVIIKAQNAQKKPNFEKTVRG
jgi:hypothetical protein